MHHAGFQHTVVPQNASGHHTCSQTRVAG
jgi:hypothetical protein